MGHSPSRATSQLGSSTPQPQQAEQGREHGLPGWPWAHPATAAGLCRLCYASVRGAARVSSSGIGSGCAQIRRTFRVRSEARVRPRVLFGHAGVSPRRSKGREVASARCATARIKTGPNLRVQRALGAGRRIGVERVRTGGTGGVEATAFHDLAAAGLEATIAGPRPIQGVATGEAGLLGPAAQPHAGARRETGPIGVVGRRALRVLGAAAGLGVAAARAAQELFARRSRSAGLSSTGAAGGRGGIGARNTGRRGGGLTREDWGDERAESLICAPPHSEIVAGPGAGPADDRRDSTDRQGAAGAADEQWAAAVPRTDR